MNSSDVLTLNHFSAILKLQVKNIFTGGEKMDSQHIQQPDFQPNAINSENKTSNKLTLVLAGLGTVIGYSLSNIIASVVTTALAGAADFDSISLSQLLTYLNRIIIFIIFVAIVLIFGAVACKEKNALVKFLLCCIGGKEIGSFAFNVICALICTVLYVRKTELMLSAYNTIIVSMQFVNWIFSALFSVLFLRLVTRKAETKGDKLSQTEAQPE